MPGNAFYGSAGWKTLRQLALQRDRFICVTPGCRQPAVVVDHIKPRKQGGTDALLNLRSFCRTCDNQSHREKGSRSPSDAPRVERVVVPGCKANGLPIDPAHPWNRPRT